jgi:hypothetical protein
MAYEEGGAREAVTEKEALGLKGAIPGSMSGNVFLMSTLSPDTIKRILT